MTAALRMRDVSFAYATAEGSQANVIDHLSFEVDEGAFVLVVGPTGSGKSTLLRLAKHEIAPAGEFTGEVCVFDRDVSGLRAGESAQLVAYVSQSPEAQIVCDTVWHEMAFGLENLGIPETEMRRRIAETCNFFGMESWFRTRTSELSGGRRQLLALASALAMRPKLLLLDEPTAMLDPVAEKDLLAALFRVNRELGVTVVVATHAPETMCDYATSAFCLVEGHAEPADLADLACPRDLGIRARGEGVWQPGDAAVVLKNVWHHYDRDADWVLRGLDMDIALGEVRAVVGANGSGKSTLLSLVAGAIRPQRGRVTSALSDDQALLPQNPKALLTCETVRDELMEWSRSGRYGASEVALALERNGLDGAPERHPFDLSAGQQQLLAIEKLLLLSPRLLLLDEPTKGLDDDARALVARRVTTARDKGATIVVATHDLGFVRAVADTVSLLFDGGLTVTEACTDFFAASWLYR